MVKSERKEASFSSGKKSVFKAFLEIYFKGFVLHGISIVPSSRKRCISSRRSFLFAVLKDYTEDTRTGKHVRVDKAHCNEKQRLEEGLKLCRSCVLIGCHAIFYNDDFF